MSQIFISYSHKDKDFVQYLAYRLSEHDVTLWIDEDRIHAGEIWRDTIHSALNTSDLMLLVITPDSMKSEEVSREWQYFLDGKKPIIPLIFKNAELHYQLKGIQRIEDFIEIGGFDKGLAKLVKSFQKFGVELDTRSDRFIYKHDPNKSDMTPFFSSLISLLVQHVRALNHAIRRAVPYEFPNIPKNAVIHTKSVQGLIGNQIWHDGFLGDIQGNLTAIDSLLSNTQLPYYIKKFFDCYQELLYADWIRYIDLNLENGHKVAYAVSIIQPDETLLNDLFNFAREFSEEFHRRIRRIRFPPPIALQLHNELSNADIKLHGVALEHMANTEFHQQSHSYYKVHCGYVRIDWINNPAVEQIQLAQTIVEKIILERFWFLSSFRMPLG